MTDNDTKHRQSEQRRGMAARGSSGVGGRGGGRRRWLQAGRRRGVASVLAMMFLILFGSLAAAMAIVSRGNVRAAATHLHVTRAMGAAETGLAIAAHRLAEAASRFVVEKGEIDGEFGWKIWTGTYTSSDGEVVVLPPPSGHPEFDLPAGLAEALANIHAADINILPDVGVSVPAIIAAPPGTDPAVYKLDAWVTTPVVALDPEVPDAPRPTAFQVLYAPLADGVHVRAIVTGYDFNHLRGDLPVTRTITQDFAIVKRVDQAIVASNPLQFGRNVIIEGDIGAAFEDVAHENAHPLVLRSDFYGLDDVLDQKLATLFDALAEYDVDGDNRLRIGHPIESQGLAGLNAMDFDGDGEADNAFADATSDTFIDEFDLFIRHYDSNGDNRVTLSPALTAGTPAEGLAPEFVTAGGDPIDDDLALLLDSAQPDRNGNGISGFFDDNGNGKWDPGETLADYDAVLGTYPDRVLGWRDGFIDRKDRYAKVTGRIVIRVDESTWVAEQGDIDEHLRGPIVPDPGESPLTFGADETLLPEVTADSFTETQSALHLAADGAPFAEQVAAQLGVSIDELPFYEETSTDPDAPKYYRLDPDNDGDALPDNWPTAHFERMPYNSPNYSDWYYRPVYENMVFKDVEIPLGTNALFVNCTFVGVTYVRTTTDNTHPNWALYGRLALSPTTGRPAPDPPRWVYGDDPGEDEIPESLPPDTTIVLMADPPLDKADLPADEAETTIGFDQLPDPLIIDGQRVIDTKLYSNNIRFHDCLFVGSIVSDTPSEYTHTRNKLQFTGATRFTTVHPDEPDNMDLNPDEEDLAEILKSSMMLPQYSVDLGSFNSPPEQNIQLKGAIITGVVDIRGNASIDGALILTFRPQAGQGPLVDLLGNPIGNPANFNSTIGYFGPEDGDLESLDPETLPIVDGVRIVGWDLDGDGLADLGPDQPPTQDEIDAGATPVPWNGYGRISIRFDPELILPDGVMLRLQVSSDPTSYSEGLPW